MPTHVVVGASRGIGYGFLQFLSKDPSNTIIGLVRTPGPTQKQVDSDGLKNVTILAADLTDHSSLLAAAKKVSSLTTDGAVDYLWNNGAFISEITAERFFDDFTPETWPELLEDLQSAWSTNVIGVLNSINAFLPLVLKSSVKKVITLSTGMADNELTSKYEAWEAGPYCISKAAVNTLVAKYDARYRSQGVLFLAVSPGLVDNGRGIPAESQLPAKFYKYNPSMTGPITPEQSVTALLKLVEVCDAQHDGGQFYSHLGKHRGWLNSV